MINWGIFGFFRGDLVPIVLGATRQMCLAKLRAALDATPHKIGDLLPLHYREFVGDDQSGGTWVYRMDVSFREFVTRSDRLGANGRH